MKDRYRFKALSSKISSLKTCISASHLILSYCIEELESFYLSKNELIFLFFQVSCIIESHFLLQFSSVQSLSCVQFFVTPWTAARQASLSITNSRSLLRFMSIESMMPSNRLILCHPLPFLASVFPSMRVFSNESALHIRSPKYLAGASASASVLPMNIQD